MPRNLFIAPVDVPIACIVLLSGLHLIFQSSSHCAVDSNSYFNLLRACLVHLVGPCPSEHTI